MFAELAIDGGREASDGRRRTGGLFELWAKWGMGNKNLVEKIANVGKMVGSNRPDQLVRTI